MAPKIYTKTGDDGSTTISGSRVLKDDSKIDAVGTLDEFNAIIGLIMAHPASGPIDSFEWLKAIQSDLFVIGAEINTGKKPDGLYAMRIAGMEREIDKMQGEMPELRNFILPGGSFLSAYYHLARTVCRRAERQCVSLMKRGTLSEQAVSYLNRLSDCLFVWARWFNGKGSADVIWRRE